ncbi:AAA family ATPase [Neorhizobium sp. T786]|uniref:AAA family ATPase n=1 Tax=Pseudorhizobium xiangyangii TaxID=2883104 RepID=UPI001CFF7D78|nr:AAA family ATPase [Neorhizobium xiangyangii]MCB5202120.1 AAA family ATPase [Neorhizobium xiangyangii]
MAQVDDIAAAATALRRAERVMVIGCSGGGKSTLSQELAAGLDLPYVPMDREFFWLPGWVKRDKAEERRLIAQTVASERWLMDGSGPSSFDLRLPRAQLVIWLRLPRWQCVLGVVKRGVRYFGRTRPDMAPGCNERFPDFEFLAYIWTFEQKFVPAILHNINLHGAHVPVVQLKSRAEMRKFLDLAGLPA